MMKTPNSLRAAQIAVGGISLVLAGFVLAFPSFALYLVAIWLSVSLLFGGIEGIVVGVGARFLSKAGRTISIFAGAVAIVLSVAILAYPGVAALTLTVVLSVALLFLGASGIARGMSEKLLSRWARTMLIVVGVITLGLSVPALLFPAFGTSLLVSLTAVALIINGVSFIVSGTTGAIFRPFNIGVSSNRKSWESDAA